MTSLKKEIIKINKMFEDGTLRYEGDLDYICGVSYKPTLTLAKMIAERHPFINGNKRTAIKFMELRIGKQVPEFVYEILEKI